MDVYLRAIGKIVFYGICLAALLKGDRPLRAAAAYLVGGALLSPIARWAPFAGRLPSGVIIVDAVVLATLAILLVRDKRWWLVAATGFMLMNLLTYFAGVIGKPTSPTVIDTGRLLWSYAAVFAIGLGLVVHERRQAALVAPAPR